MCRKDGSICATLFGDVDRPRALAVDSDVGYLFWTQWGRKPGIYMSGMDGSEKEVIANTSLQWPNGLSYDTTTHREYSLWCHNSDITALMS